MNLRSVINYACDYPNMAFHQGTISYRHHFNTGFYFLRYNFNSIKVSYIHFWDTDVMGKCNDSGKRVVEDILHGPDLCFDCVS